MLVSLEPEGSDKRQTIPISSRFPDLVFDARCGKVRHGGLLVDCAKPVAMGAGGKRTIPGVSAALSEAEGHWRSFFIPLVTHGLHDTRFIVSVAHHGMAAARKAVFPSVPWQLWGSTPCKVGFHPIAAQGTLPHSPVT